MPTNQTSNLLYDFLTAPRFRWGRHILFLAVLICIAFGQSFFVFSSYTDTLGSTVYLFVGSLAVLSVTLAYFNLYYLVPRLLLKNKYTEYFLSLAGMITLFMAGKYLAECRILNTLGIVRTFNGITLLDIFSNLTLNTICITGSLITVLFQQWLTDTTRINTLENQNLKNSITQLKEHIHPDFLFRVIRYASDEVERDPAKISDLLFKLGELLRYELYDCKRGRVILKSDIGFINDYLSLEQQLSDTFTYTLTVTGPTNRFIRPFVFMPAIQETMKRLPRHIDIRFTVENEVMELECEATEGTVQNPPITTLRLKYAD